MRTTLKRGIGRAAGANGNGRSVLPPSALTPMARYRQPEPPRKTRIEIVGRIVLWLLIAVMCIALGLVGGAYLFFHESVAAIVSHSPGVRNAQVDLKVPPPNHAAIALIIGYDHRANEVAGTPSRSDTMMLLRADPVTNTISLLSFPRDMLVDIHCPGVGLYQDKINAAYARCGPRGSLDTVQALTGLPINYLITVNFHGFKEVVDKLGGVYVDIDRRYHNNNQGLGSGFTYATINLNPGYQRLNGAPALDYVRYRHTDSDLYRVARQQLFVEAMKQQFKRNFSLTSVPGIIGAITRNVEVGVGGGKAITPGTVLSYALFAYHLPPGHFFQAKIGGLTGYSQLTTDPSNIATAVQQFESPDVAAPGIATAVALGKKPHGLPPKPEKTTVTALNGNGHPGDGATAAYLLRQRGYQTLTPPAGSTGNAPSFDYFHTAVFFDPKQRRSTAAAKVLAKLFVPADTLPLTPALRPLANGAMVTVVVGKTFHGTIAPPPPTTTPQERQPPQVVHDPGATSGLLAAAQKKLAFPVMVPTMLEQTSQPSSEVPITVYDITRHHLSARLTFVTGGLQYWGIQETDWKDAPILGERNVRHVTKGREYDFYFNGPELHMIVLRTPKATYWVVNTLLNTISNETMLAIAEGLQPLAAAK